VCFLFEIDRHCELIQGTIHTPRSFLIASHQSDTFGPVVGSELGDCELDKLVFLSL
jgi:hypothetical protein